MWQQMGWKLKSRIKSVYLLLWARRPSREDYRAPRQPRFELQGCLLEWVPPSPPKALGGALMILHLYCYVLSLKGAPPNCIGIGLLTTPASYGRKGEKALSGMAYL